jgi:hypothetical protein
MIVKELKELTIIRYLYRGGKTEESSFNCRDILFDSGWQAVLCSQRLPVQSVGQFLT